MKEITFIHAADLHLDSPFKGLRKLPEALFQHINGHISYIDVLDAQRSYLNAEIDLTHAVRDEYIALIELYKALGGGWRGEKQ